MLVTGDAEMGELARWFDELWQDSVDISEALVVELERSWALAQTPPYHVYLKALYELYGSGLSEDLELPLPTGPVELANFQVDAVRWGLTTIDRYGGLLHRRRRWPGQDIHWGGAVAPSEAELQS